LTATTFTGHPKRTTFLNNLKSAAYAETVYRELSRITGRDIEWLKKRAKVVIAGDDVFWMGL